MRINLQENESGKLYIEVPDELITSLKALETSFMQVQAKLAEVGEVTLEETEKTELVTLREEVERLGSPEHEAEIVSQRAGSLTVDDWWRIGEQRGYASKPMTEAELAEEKVPEAELSEAEKPKEEQEGVLIEGTNIRIV